MNDPVVWKERLLPGPWYGWRNANLGGRSRIARAPKIM